MAAKKVRPVRHSDGARKSKRKSPHATGRRLSACGNAQAGKRAGRIPGVDIGEVVALASREKRVYDGITSGTIPPLGLRDSGGFRESCGRIDMGQRGVMRDNQKI